MYSIRPVDPPAHCAAPAGLRLDLASGQPAFEEPHPKSGNSSLRPTGARPWSGTTLAYSSVDWLQWRTEPRQADSTPVILGAGQMCDSRASLLILSGFLLVFLRTGSSLSGELRIWKDRTGKFEVVAEFVDSTESLVRLRRRDDARIIEVPTAVLSEADNAFLKTLLSSKPTLSVSRQMPVTRIRTCRSRRTKRTAKGALALYQDFIEASTTDDEERKQALKSLGRWELAAKLEFVRIGSVWLSRKDANLLVQRETDILGLAETAIASDDVETGEKWLLESGRANPDGIRGYFRLGLLCALHSLKLDAKEAEKCFSQCVKRRESNVRLKELGLLD